MAESKFRSLFDDPDRYVKSFKTFAARSKKYEVLADWGDNVFSEAVVEHLPFKLNENDELRVLGVGSGSGEMDCKMLTKLMQRYPRINNRVVEPAEDHIVQYKALTQSMAHELQGVSFDWRQQTLEQYIEAGDQTKFHFISAIHSIYHVDDVDSSLMYLYDRLEPSGILLVIIVSDDSGDIRFWNHISSFKDQIKKYWSISSADVRSSFDRRNIPYTLHHQRSQLEITKCFDEVSEEGRLLVDFIIHVAKFKETATEDQQKQVMEYLASSHCSEKDGDEVLFNNDWDAVISSKPSE